MNTNETVTAYPLSWPIGWKRTTAAERVRGRFNRKERGTTTFASGASYKWTRGKELSIADSLARLQTELRGFGVDREDIIISTNLDVRNDGLPRSGQRAPLDPGAAVYWSRAGEGQRCMAIDQYDRVADNLAAFEGFVSLPAPQGANWWEVLGVARTADKDTIRDAYRSKVKIAHPDNTETGDAEKFIVIQKAYEASNA